LEKLILVTGATGYIASRLIPQLLERGYRVRALARDPRQLAGRAWASRVEVVEGDVTLPEPLVRAVAGVHTAYYLIHNMALGRGYTARELDGARNFASAAEKAKVQHIVYLGGLADPADEPLAPHLRSRMETGEVLRRGKVPVTEFRAGVIVGPGSISFEMIRFMTELFPVVTGPTWLRNKSQPIATQNVMDYLLAALENPDGRGRVFEIGGTEVIPYGDLMLRYARRRGLRRSLVMLPGIPLWFMASGVGMMTPVPRPIAYALIGGLANDSVIRHDEARRVFPQVKLIGYEEATSEALGNLSPLHVERVWEGLGRDVANFRHEGFFVNSCCRRINTSPEAVYRVLTSMGGGNGWPYANWLWGLRGRLDRLFGGPGLRGREDVLRPGSVLDYYRVESIEPKRLLRLHSELRAPGEGWMEWRMDGNALIQTAFFAPRGFSGFLYWYLLYAFHTLVFRGLIRAILKRSESK
jgi:uncharacterized protein YbjT (DUF2867 family)